MYLCVLLIASIFNVYAADSLFSSSEHPWHVVGRTSSIHLKNACKRIITSIGVPITLLPINKNVFDGAHDFNRAASEHYSITFEAESGFYIAEKIAEFKTESQASNFGMFPSSWTKEQVLNSIAVTILENKKEPSGQKGVDLFVRKISPSVAIKVFIDKQSGLVKYAYPHIHKKRK